MQNANSEDFNTETPAGTTAAAKNEKTARKSVRSKQEQIPTASQTAFSPAPRRFFPFRFSRHTVLLIMTGLVMAILMGLVVHASYRNTDKYYLRSAAGAVEIWQGTFSPGGKKRILIMPGVQKPAEMKTVYSQETVFPLAFNFYVSKADALMAVTGMPDFVGIKSYLNRALSFATTEEHHQTAHARINQIDRMILFYKADVAATKGTREGLEAALDYLDQAATLNPDEIETELIQKKKANILKLLETL